MSLRAIFIFLVCCGFSACGVDAAFVLTDAGKVRQVKTKKYRNLLARPNDTRHVVHANYIYVFGPVHDTPTLRSRADLFFAAIVPSWQFLEPREMVATSDTTGYFVFPEFKKKYRDLYAPSGTAWVYADTSFAPVCTYNIKQGQLRFRVTTYNYDLPAQY